MKKFLHVGFIILALVLLGFASWLAIWKIAVYQKAHYYAAFSDKEFTSAFKQAHIAYPPQQLAFLVFKNKKQMQIYARNDQDWHYIKTLPILAASGHSGPKLHEGDKQVPEGIYQITELNPFSDYTLSMKINYPNDFDKDHATRDHRTNLGGDIFIHGSNLSIGCMAMGNAGIEQLFPLVYQVGVNNVMVIIAPNDLRVAKALEYAGAPSWTSELYGEITEVLTLFPLHTLRT